MPHFVDPEFGEITIRRLARARYVRIKVGTDGRYTATAPLLTPVTFVKHMVATSRDELRKLASHTSIVNPYSAGQQIGKTHRIAVVPSTMVSTPQVTVVRSRIVVTLPPSHSIENQSVQQLIRDTVTKALRREAKAVLPVRLARLAHSYGFHYSAVRFSHSGGRWGSCSSGGTISLNIALMKLPDTLIDYVLAHELCHTRHMNHSRAFWREVELVNPLYRVHRQQLKKHTPSV